MNIQFRHRCLSMMLVLVMLFSMMPTSVIAEELHDHEHEVIDTIVTADEAVQLITVEALKLNASASANHVYVGDGAVTVTAGISGGVAPYDVTLQAVKNGAVAATQKATAQDGSAKLAFTPAAYGDYELVVTVRDAAGSQELVSISLAVAEHDTESEADWTASVSGASVTSNWGRSLVSVAKTQIGYTESEKDFILKNGAKQGYSRYGAWFGTPYASWNTAFLAFVAEYAQIPGDALLSGSSYRSWVNGMSAKGAFHKGDEYAPQAGDIAFLSGSRVGVIESVKGTDVTVIEGDVNGEVVRKTYAISKLAGIGNTGLLQGLHNGTATAVPTGAPEATKAPADVTAAPATVAPTAAPTATPVPNAGGELTFKATPTPGPNVTVAPKDDVNILDSIVSDVNEVVTELDAAATAVPMQFSEAYYLMKDEMAKLVEKYLGTATPTEDEIQAFVDGLDMQDVYYILTEFADLIDYSENIGLSEYEANALLEVEDTFVGFNDAVNDHWSAFTAVRAEHEFLDKKLTITNSNSTVTTASGTTYVLSVEGGLFGREKTDVTIKNNSGKKGQLSFDYAVSGNYSNFKIAGNSATPPGSYSVTLDPEASVVVHIEGNGSIGAGKATLTLSNIKFEEAKAANVTFVYDESLGIVTVGGTEVGSGASAEVPADGATLVATPNSGVTFLGWTDTSGKIQYTEANPKFTPAGDITLQAVFAKDGGTPWFGVGGTASSTETYNITSKFTYYNVNCSYLFDNLEDAATFAYNNDSSLKTIVLMNNGTLPAGNYTIPSGVTLLIPFDDANTMYTTFAQANDSLDGPTAYRTLTMAQNANLMIEGAVSVSGKLKYANTDGRGSSPNGKVGFINMASGSSITVNNGGALYAYGYITGSGTVTANSGSKIYECFQIMDFRGGTCTDAMSSGDNEAKGVFPLSQYYVVNIEVPLTLNQGATEYSYAALYMSSQFIASSIAFIANDGAMFNLTRGSVTKSFDGDRMHISLNENSSLSVQPIEIDMTFNVVVTTIGFDINSKNFELPIHGKITMTAKSGSTLTLNQDIAMLPDAVITIDEGATCTLGSGNNIYFYDRDEWGGYTHGNQTGYTVKKGVYDPQNDAKIVVNGTVDASQGFVYTTAGGANICSDGTGVITMKYGSETVTYQVTQDNTTPNYVEIPITSAKLKNAVTDWPYTLTENMTEAQTFEYIDGRWTCTVAATSGLIHVRPDDKQYSCQDYNCKVCGLLMEATVDHTSPTGSYCKPFTCRDCGEEVSTIEQGLMEHTYGADATCTTAQVCTVCDTVLIAALGHTEVVDVDAVDPTCTDPGKTEGSHCSVCNEVLTVSEEIPALGHTVVTDAAVAPTCTDPGKTEGSHCSVCDEVLVAQETVTATGHSHTPAVTAPTCTADGYTTYTCTCGDTYTDDKVEALGHTEADAVKENEVAAECEEEGSYDSVVYCSVCNTELSRETVTVPATGHSYTSVVTAPTCTEKGYTTYTCTCGDTYTDDEVDALGHTEVVDAAVAAKCAETGLTEGSHCSVCGETLVAQEVIDALGHDEVVDEAVAPTCTTTGLTEGKKCSRCGITVVAQEVVDALGHTEVVDAAVAPTCSATGKTEGKHCSVCKEVLVAQTDVDMVPHAAADAVKENEVAAKCEEKGSYDSVVYCSVCDAEMSRTSTTVPALGHSKDVDDAVAATCTTAGKTEGSHCSVCNEVLVAQKEIPATGHTAATAVQENVVNATCTAEGSYESVVYCSVCKVELSRTTVTTDPSGHNYTSVVTAPTCTTAGYTTCTCGKCGDTYTRDEVDALGHTEAAAVRENEVAATCADAGSYESVVYCSVCKAELSRETKTIDKLPHTKADAVEENRQNPTCAAAGSYDSVVYCSVCNAELNRNKITIDKLTHTEVVDAAVAPTCTTTGKTEGSHCSVCGETIIAQEVVDALGHTEVVDKAVAPTCTATGLTEGSHCSVCGETLVAQEVVDALGHTEVVDAAVAAKCTETGLTEGKHCSVCGETLVAQEVVDALGHTEVVDEAVAPTCTTTGLTEGKHCSVCGETLVAQEEVAALGHKPTRLPAVEPTCTETGLTAGSKCSVCNETIVAQEEVPALGHTKADAVKENEVAAECEKEGSYDSVVYCSVCDTELSRETVTVPATGHSYTSVVTAPTCTEKGYTTYTCGKCDDTYTGDEVNALGHTEVVEAAVAPTCTTTGLTEGKHCSVCEEVLVAQEVVDALGHTEVVDAAVAPTCTATGKTEGKHCSVCKEVLVAQNVVDMLGHAYESVVTAPTCTEKGYTTHTCSRCGNTYKDTYTNATGHKYESVVTAPTCTTGGYTTNTCSVCTDSYMDDQVPATGHIAADAVKENEVAPTCSEKGSYDSVVYCSVESCKAELSRETKTIDTLPHTDGDVVVENNKDATCTVNGSYDNVTYCTVCKVETSRKPVTITAPGHTTVVDNAVAPTCTATGLTEGSHCSVCNATIKAQEEVPALGHKNGEPVKENAVAATCTVNGSYDNVTYCTVCKVETNRDTVTVTAPGHTLTTGAAKAATCTEIGWNAYEECSKCDYTTYQEISATGHTLTQVGAKKETCTEIGWNAYEKCSKCDYTTYQEIPASGHSYTSEVTTKPTCTATGVETFTCACGDTYTKTVAANGHSMVHEGAVNPTCETPGSAAHSECSVCGYTEAEYVIPALGHTYEREGDESAKGEVTTAPTCTDTGIRTFTCTDCGKENTKAIDALGHTPGAAATCTTPQVCTVCSTVLKAALDHIAGEAKVENNVAPTCTVAGSYDTVVRCTRCNEVLSSEHTIVPAKDHTPGAAVVENNNAPNCETETDGSYETVVYCSVCSTEISREKTTVEWAHNPNVEEATCTQQKYCLTCSKTLETVAHTPDRETATCTEAKKCTECGTELEEAKGHTPAVAVKENEVAATCTAAGSYDSVVYCSVAGCDAEISRETITVEKLDHKGGAPAVENTVAATCSKEGSYESVVYCSDCEEELSRETKTIAKLAHTPGEGVEENKVSATCTQKGSYELVVYCTVCNAEISRTAKTIVATGHEYTGTVTAPTCTEQGYTTYICSGCDDSYTDNYVNATGHKSEPAVEENRTESTCTVAGQYESVVYCSVCETELSRETVKLELAAHTAAEAVEENRVESTCTAEGSYDMVVYCSECNAEIDRDTTTIKKKDHTPGTAVVENEKAATCTATGSYDTVVYCSECKTYEFSRVTTTTDMLDHTPGAVVMENVVKADCDKETNGSYDSVVYCTVCKNKLSSKTVVVPYEHKPGTAATCTQPQICTVCGNTLADILPHTADREEATCTEAKTCTECEKVLQKATGHKPAAAVKEKEVVATCTTAGSYESVVYCSTCNEEQSRETVTVDKLEHEGGEPVVENTVAATCSKEGSYESVVYCSDCKTELSREPKVIEKLAHTPGEGVEENMVAATCTVDGSYELVVYCTVCNEEQSRTSVKISADGHKSEPAVEENRTESTCTVAGQYESVVYCSVCETELSRETVKLELAAHTAAEAVEENRVESTCTAEGSYDVVVYCSACKNELSREAFKIAADGHKAGTPVEENRTEASCYTNGKYDEVVYCTVCDAEMTRKTVTIQAPNKHAYGSPVVTKPATCTAEGSQQSTCTRCGSIKNETVAMVAHQYVAAVTEPTCVAEGYTTYTCSECGYNYTADTKEALGHTPSTAVMENEKASTCTAEGSYDMVVYCSVCGSEVERKTFEIEMKPHTEGEAKTEQEVAATCTVDGSYDTVVYCSVCNTELNRTTITVKAEGHKYESVVTAPTCTAMGYTTYTCSVCGDTYTGDETEMLSHAYETVVTAPTCTEAGFTTYICSVCGKTYTDDEVAKLGHKYESVVTAPTCTATGYTTYTCSVCGDTYTGDETEMLSHAYETVVTDPTCTEAGFTTYTCSVCGKTYTDDEVAKLGHRYDAMVTEPTCTTEGFTTHTCSVCGHTYTDNKTPPTGHSYKPTVTAPTCTEGGYTTYTCSKCGTSQVRDQVPPAGHNPVVDPYKAPTCENTGLTEGSHCSVCNETLTAQEPIDALEHNYEASVTLEPTCTEAGVRTFVCENDATHTYTESIDALGHDEVEHEAQVVTCTAIGWDAYVTCKRCDYTTYVEIAALGHDMDEGVEDPKHTCTTAGKLTRTCKNGCGLTETTDVLAQHTPEIIPAVDPTCTDSGLTAGEKCSVCGEITKEPQIVEASHKWETVAVITAATCTTQGKEDVRCVKCDAADTIVTPALGHTEVIDAAVAKTCTTDGLTEGSHCSVCNETLVAQEVVPASHEWSAAPCMYISAKCNDCGKTNEAVLDHAWSEATCSAPATCAYCNRTMGSTLPHTEEIDDEIPATCTTTGLTAGKHCSVCGYTISAQSIIPAYEHMLKDGVTSAIVQYAAKNPTFTTPGWEAYEACSRCNYTTYDEIPALGEQSIDTFQEMLDYLPYLEEWAVEYAKKTPGTDPVALVIKYIRTGVDRYNSGSWGIMAGYEDKGFAEYVAQKEDAYNSAYTKDEYDKMIQVTGLKNLKLFILPNDPNFMVDFGHMFGTMDITYTNKGSENHADVGGWAGDLVDLLSTSDHDSHQALIESAGDDFEELVTVIRTKLLGYDFDHDDTFALNDYYGDLDAFYIMETMDTENYAAGDMTELFKAYFSPSLDDVARANFLLVNRFDDVRTRSAIREAVYTEYTTNAMISTLEGTREFKNTDDLITRRKAVCYAFADYLCMLAGDWVDDTDNPYLTDYESSYSLLAPGISMEIHKATSADNKNMVYYLGYADLARADVDVMAIYHDRYVEPGDWGMSRVLDQANAAAEQYHANPESEHYIENFAPVIAINGAGFNMGTGEPSGLLVMHGEEIHAPDGNGFFGITKSGKAVIGTTAEYNSTYKGELAEGIAGFGTMLVANGELWPTLPTTSYYSDRASRTAVGITATGRVVFMVLDGRQEPWSCGGSMIEIAQIMKLAGCVTAINLDGGGSTTFVARQAGDEELSLVNRPSDGVQRSVSTSLMMYSTAPSSKTFDNALIGADYNFMTVGAEVNVTATGLSATNNIVALPEGATWAVSDPEMAEIVDAGDVVIDEDDPTVKKKNAKVIAKKLGEFEVYLMLDGVIIGQKTLGVIIPDQLYFTRDKIDGIYGKGVELPLKARYEGKEAAYVTEDVTFTISSPDVGTMEGLTFNVVEESDVKTVAVTAALAQNEEVTASIDVVLYKEGENNFNFDTATGGNRELAWLREVSNAKQEGTSTYYIVDPDEKMVINYTIALDMSQIPIPEKLASLTYMLPGADLEGASAWTFLLQLAERMSELTTVSAEFKIDPNFTVVGYDAETGEFDASGITVINEYFLLDAKDGILYDPQESVLTLKLHWDGQISEAIDPSAANPMCIVNGLKLLPKDDAAWDDKDCLVAVNTAEVSYKVYMRANALHTFAAKPENQEQFGLYPYGPYTNSRGVVENGGWFASTYATFKDTYTLVKSLKNGWTVEEGGFRYYINGQYLTGIHFVEGDTDTTVAGLYYQFDENGINIGQTPYTGKHVMDGKHYYMQNGKPYKGWITLDDGNWYLFDWQTAAGIHGSYTEPFTHELADGTKFTNNVVYEFENGRLLDGVWHQDHIGWRYYYGPWYYKQGWRELTTQEGQKNGTGEKAMFFFEEFYVQKNVSPVQEAHAIYEYWYEFTPEGALVRNAPSGLYWWDDDWYKGENGTKEPELYYVDENHPEGNGYSLAVKDGLYYIDGYYYFFDLWTGMAKRNTTYWIHKENAHGLPMSENFYRFDNEGRIIIFTGVVKESDGNLYYYRDGARCWSAGLISFDGHIYGVDRNAQCYVNTAVEITRTNGLVSETGVYRFDEYGHLIQDERIANEDGSLYYYNEEGKRDVDVGLVKYAGDIYYIGLYTITGVDYNKNTAIAAAGVEIDIPQNKTNDLLAAGTYRFDENGKAILTTELVEGDDGKLYYYVNGALQKGAGMIKYNDAYYYIDANGAAVTNTEVLIEKPIAPFPADTYEFDENGKMIIREGIYEGYYYAGGIKTAAGLVEEEGKYYFAAESGKIVTDVKYDVQKTNDLVPAGIYRIGADGVLNMETELADEDGTLFYYKNGMLAVNEGLIQIDGDYYYIDENGSALVNAKKRVADTKDYQLTAGTYRFGADGKAILTTELVKEEDGKLYYYKNGRMADRPELIEYEGDYYWVEVNGFVLTSQKISLSAGQKLPAGVYRIGEDGKIILTTALVNENGNLTYYKNGVLTKNAGLIKLDDAYYYINDSGYAVVNGKYDVIKHNNFKPAGIYRFNKSGKMIETTEVAKDADGKYYYYVEGKLTKDVGLIKYGDAYYYITEDGTAVTSAEVLVEKTIEPFPVDTYEFDAEGKMIIYEGIRNGYYYVAGVKTAAGLVQVDGAYYYAGEGGKLAASEKVNVIDTKDYEKSEGVYRFDESGKMIETTEVAKESDGKYYYYFEGKLGKDAGLVKVGAFYYYITADGTAVTDSEIEVSEGQLPAGIYRFDEEGKADLTTELVKDDDGRYYYYVNGALAKNAGLIEYNGAYYYIDDAGIAVTSTKLLVEKTNDLFPVDTYEFGADGKMVIYEGIVNGYYYVAGVKTEAGLVEIDGDYYYAAEGGKIVTSAMYEITKTNDLLAAGTYEFDADGKIVMNEGLVEQNGKLNYYESGKLGKDAGLVKVGEDYYYIDAEGAAATDEKVDVVADKTNGLDFEPGIYRFNEDGTANMATEIAAEDGKLIYYKNGRLAKGAGLVQVEDDYYYIDEEGAAVTDTKMDVEDTNNLLPEGNYEFGEDGKIVMKNGLIEENGKLYYYEDGRLAEDEGLIKIEEDYYYIDVDGAAVTETRMDVVKEKTNDLLPEGNYCFGEDGKMFERLAGDADNDNDVDLDDAVLIFNYIAGEAVKINKLNADANADGEVNVHDALLILQQQAGWDVELK